jgi:hypothetical protein
MWVVIKADKDVHVLHQDRDAFRIMNLTLRHGIKNAFYTDDLDEAYRKELSLTHDVYNETVAEYRVLCDSF